LFISSLFSFSYVLINYIQTHEKNSRRP